MTARIIGGSSVALVNFSNRGVLFECDSRLLVGARASVRITTTDASVVVTGKVVRCRVKGVVNGALRYDAALALDEELTLAMPAHLEAEDALAPPGELEDAVGADIPPDDAGGVSDAPPDEDLVQLFASVPHDLAELRRLAHDNQW